VNKYYHNLAQNVAIFSIFFFINCNENTNGGGGKNGCIIMNHVYAIIVYEIYLTENTYSPIRQTTHVEMYRVCLKVFGRLIDACDYRVV